jgi:RimJ/RimL family protein N-acetyltransferase
MLATERLRLERLTCDDSTFILGLLNEPGFIAFIGDKGVRTEDDARQYLRDGPIGSYATNGFGLYLVRLSDSGEPVGICGLVKRDEFDEPDLGFAFCEEHWGKGFASEASQAVLEHGRLDLGLRRIIAIADADNVASVKVLNKLGFRFERRVTMPGESDEVCLYGIVD